VIRGTRSKIMTAWRQVLELMIENEDLSRLTTIARSRTEPASRVERAQMLLAYRADASFFAVGRALRVHHQTVQRCSAAWSGLLPMVRWRRSTIGRGPARNPRSRLRPRLGWCRWPAGRRRNWAIRMNCGRRDCWPAMRGNMGRLRGTSVLPIWSRVRCARFSTTTK
jgi:hypothetical protein